MIISTKHFKTQIQILKNYIKRTINCNSSHFNTIHDEKMHFEMLVKIYVVQKVKVTYKLNTFANTKFTINNATNLRKEKVHEKKNMIIENDSESYKI